MTSIIVSDNIVEIAKTPYQIRLNVTGFNMTEMNQFVDKVNARSSSYDNQTVVVPLPNYTDMIPQLDICDREVLRRVN
jgi:hypothetical protein